MFTQDSIRPLSAIEKIVLLFFTPFFIWSFLGGHKQFIAGVNTDHIATAIAFMGSTLVFLTTSKLPKKFLVVLSFFIVLFLFFLLSIFNSNNFFDSTKIFFINFVYIYITLGLALLFKNRLNLFFDLVIWASLISSIIVLLSFLFLGMGSWLRVTIPVYEGDYFSYFPHGYESSSDPNVLSYFLYTGALVLLYLKGVKSYWWIALSIIIFAGLLTMSRSGFLGFFLAVSFCSAAGVSIVLYRQRINKNYFIRALGFVIFVSFLVFLLFFLYDFSSVFNLVEARIYSTGSNESRIERLIYSYNDFVDNSVYILLFGNGLGYTRINVDPHLFWASILLDTGLISLALTIFIFVYLFIKSYFSVQNSKLKCLVFSLFLFFIIVSFLYWQLRTFYFISLIFILLYLSEDELLLKKGGFR